MLTAAYGSGGAGIVLGRIESSKPAVDMAFDPRIIDGCSQHEASEEEWGCEIVGQVLGVFRGLELAAADGVGDQPSSDQSPLSHKSPAHRIEQRITARLENHRCRDGTNRLGGQQPCEMATHGDQVAPQVAGLDGPDIAKLGSHGLQQEIHPFRPVPIDRRSSDSGPLGNGLDRCPGESPLGNHLHRGRKHHSLRAFDSRINAG